VGGFGFGGYWVGVVGRGLCVWGGLVGGGCGGVCGGLRGGGGGCLRGGGGGQLTTIKKMMVYRVRNAKLRKRMPMSAPSTSMRTTQTKIIQPAAACDLLRRPSKPTSWVLITFISFWETADAMMVQNAITCVHVAKITVIAEQETRLMFLQCWAKFNLGMCM